LTWVKPGVVRCISLSIPRSAARHRNDIRREIKENDAEYPVMV